MKRYEPDALAVKPAGSVNTSMSMGHVSVAATAAAALSRARAFVSRVSWMVTGVFNGTRTEGLRTRPLCSCVFASMNPLLPVSWGETLVDEDGWPTGPAAPIIQGEPQSG